MAAKSVLMPLTGPRKIRIVGLSSANHGGGKKGHGKHLKM
jgi:hypothetical protein